MNKNKNKKSNKKKKRQRVLSTQGGKKRSRTDNISAVFGSKFLKTLQPFECDLSSLFEEDIQKANENKLKENIKANEKKSKEHSENVLYKAIGYISKSGEGIGRNSTDRQFLFVRGRPVDIPLITKSLNEGIEFYLFIDSNLFSFSFIYFSTV